VLEWSEEASKICKSSLICPQRITNIFSVMNTTYKTIYQVDKYENQVSALPKGELEEAVEGLSKIKNDKNITIWDCEEYQVIALKA
jgi:hypothetical protein